MDLYSRRIVGWSMSDTMQAKMVKRYIANSPYPEIREQGHDLPLSSKPVVRCAILGSNRLRRLCF